MPIYEYVGIDAKGKRATGTVDAESDRSARVKLRRMNIFPTSIGHEGNVKQRMSFDMQVDLSKYLERVKVEDISLMTRQFATLLGANIPLVDAITALIEQIENKKLQKAMSRVREKVLEGAKLSDSLKIERKLFGNMYINMINAGESSGSLDVVMSRLADFMEAQADLKSKVTGAMIYPVIMSVVATVLLTLLLILVVPKITDILLSRGKALPVPTQILIFISDTLKHYWYVCIAAIIAISYSWRRFTDTTTGKKWWHKKQLNIAGIGRLIKMIAIARFSRTLSTLLSSGVPLLSAMGIVQNIMSNVILQGVIEKTRNSLREGQSVAEPLKRSGYFPALVVHMISVGEKTGEIEQMLERIADTYDNEVKNALSAFTSMLEPLMIVGMAIVIAFIVMAILLPMMEMNKPA